MRRGASVSLVAVLLAGLLADVTIADDPRSAIKTGLYRGKSEEGLKVEFVVEGRGTRKSVVVPTVKSEECGRADFELDEGRVNEDLRFDMQEGVIDLIGRFFSDRKVRGKFFFDCQGDFRWIEFKAERRGP